MKKYEMCKSHFTGLLHGKYGNMTKPHHDKTVFPTRSDTNPAGERGGSVVERRTPEREVGVESYLRCCVLDQDTLLPESTGNTQEAVAPSRHD